MRPEELSGLTEPWNPPACYKCGGKGEHDLSLDLDCEERYEKCEQVESDWEACAEINRRGKAIDALSSECARLREALAESTAVLKDLAPGMWANAQARQFVADEDDEEAIEIRGWFKRRDAALDAARAALEGK